MLSASHKDERCRASMKTEKAKLSATPLQNNNTTCSLIKGTFYGFHLEFKSL